ncbi:MAG TPA: PilZ domain-containing protein [Nitrospirae bacterium]|nr:PilZ domain protein [bacterium BMS3Abin06]HDH12036.1 PilZ domain-containing protein [Nitrospirota bacterium]HDZ00856.1 PilZ domain-containing protein [Nitrospirota bacterium]
MTAGDVNIMTASSILNKKKMRDIEAEYIPKERRAFERFPANLDARLFYGNLIYTGMVKNLSQNGMFVSTKVNFPLNSEFIMVVLLNNRTIKLPVKVRRKVRKESGYYSKMDDGIGVELLEPPQNFLDYAGSRKSSTKFSF